MSDLGLDLLFICMWLQFINILAIFLSLQNSPFYLVTVPKLPVFNDFLSRRRGERWSSTYLHLHTGSTSVQVKCGFSRGLCSLGVSTTDLLEVPLMFLQVAMRLSSFCALCRVQNAAVGSS